MVKDLLIQVADSDYKRRLGTKNLPFAQLDMGGENGEAMLDFFLDSEYKLI